ncbi:MAG TPA: sugar phosphate isomerase/epimerase [Gemmatimonadaceae bacterium]|nr:sugar phosphate isomerase/epimerase [Gemmatimonadaceae bacterium]
MTIDENGVSRRTFVRTLAGALAAGGIAAACARAAGASVLEADAAGVTTGNGVGRLGAIGVQLYSVRDLMDKDVEGTLAALAAIGYREVEFAGLHGRTAADLRGMLKRHSLVSPSSHVSLEDAQHNWDRTLADLTTLGNTFVVIPWIDDTYRTVDGYKRVAAMFNTAAAAARKAGLQFAYHNHDYEFAPVEGQRPYDILLAECDPDLVRMEMDLYWIVKGGGDPLAYIARYPGRFPLIHAKDMAKNGDMVDVGKGTIDFSAILAQSDKAGIRHCFVEHDDPPHPLEDLRTSYEYLRRLTY